jgi:hypothetical protein
MDSERRLKRSLISSADVLRRGRRLLKPVAKAVLLVVDDIWSPEDVTLFQGLS